MSPSAPPACKRRCAPSVAATTRRDAKAILLVVPRTEHHTLGSFVLADQWPAKGLCGRHRRPIVTPANWWRCCASVDTTWSASPPPGAERFASVRELVDIIHSTATRVTPVIIGGPILDKDIDVRALTGADHTARDAASALMKCGLLQAGRIAPSFKNISPRRGRSAGGEGQRVMNTRGSDFLGSASGTPPSGLSNSTRKKKKKIFRHDGGRSCHRGSDTQGTVKSVITNPLNPTLGRLDHWKDRDIREFMAEDSLSKLESQLEAYRDGRKSAVDCHRGEPLRQREFGNSSDSATPSTRRTTPTSS